MTKSAKLISGTILIIVIVVGIFFAVKSYSQKKVAGENVAPTPELTNFINQSEGEITQPASPPAGRAGTTLAQTVDTLKPICQGNDSGSFKCYENYYTDLVKTKGIPAAFTDIKAREKSDSYVLSQCHPLSHSIGHAAAMLYPDILDAFAHGDSFCWSGYYHGIMEEIIDKKGKEKTLAELNTICSRVPGKATYSFDYYNCVHGLGHGLMGTAGQNLFEALKMCDNLTDGWDRSSCYSGVFMENVIIENKGGTTKYLRPTEPIYPCNAVGENYKQVCYLMQTSYMLKVSGNSFSKVFDLCASVESQYQATCYQSLGRDASGQSSSNVEKTKATCYLGDNFEQKSNCIIGAVKDFISYYHSDEQAKKLCASLTQDLQTICSQTAESYYKSF